MQGNDNFSEQDPTDYVFMCEILEDEDVIDDWGLWKSDDDLVLWLVREKLERVFYCE